MPGKQYDKIIIGAGLYGLYAAKYSMDKGESVLVLEYDSKPFSRATYCNQARVHMGYHYPRSLSTAMKSAGYFKRFFKDYSFCIYDTFEQVYATAAQFSWTGADQFKEFCKAADIKCEEVSPSTYFKDGMCDGAFLTEEYTYDAALLLGRFEEELRDKQAVAFCFDARIKRIEKHERTFEVWMEDGKSYEAPYILNATYASVNQIIGMLEGEKEYFDIKYELCETILCEPSANLKGIGITVMDGPFFSIMPFGKTGMHSLTSVSFTPHTTSYDKYPLFRCQQTKGCSGRQLENCNECSERPPSAWMYMSHLADKYMKEEYAYQYSKSLYSIKPILKSSEIDDSRPTAIRVLSRDPVFVSVLSGKINTVYDLDDYL